MTNKMKIIMLAANIMAATPNLKFFPQHGVVKINKPINYTILHRYDIQIPYVISHMSPILDASTGSDDCFENSTETIQQQINEYLKEVMVNYIIEPSTMQQDTNILPVEWHFPGDEKPLIRDLECSIALDRPICSQTTDEKHCNNNLNCCFSYTNNKCYAHTFEYEPLFEYIKFVTNKIDIKSINYHAPNKLEYKYSPQDLGLLTDNKNTTGTLLNCTVPTAILKTAPDIDNSIKRTGRSIMSMREAEGPELNIVTYKNPLTASVTRILSNTNIYYDHSWIVHFDLAEIQSVSIFSTRKHTDIMKDYIQAILTPKHTLVITTLDQQGVYQRAKKTKCIIQESFPGEYIFDCKGAIGNALLMTFEFSQKFCTGISLNEVIITEKPKVRIRREVTQIKTRVRRQVGLIISALAGIFGGTAGGALMGKYASQGYTREAIKANNRILFKEINNNYVRLNKLHQDQFQYLQLFQDDTQKNFDNVKDTICGLQHQIESISETHIAQKLVQKFLDDIEKNIMAFETGILPYGNPHYKQILQLCMTLNKEEKLTMGDNIKICEEILFKKIVKIDHIKAIQIGDNNYVIDIIGYFVIPKVHVIKTEISELYNIPVPKEELVPTEPNLSTNRFEYRAYTLPSLEMKLDNGVVLPILAGQCTYSDRLNLAIFCPEAILNQINDQHAFCLSSIPTKRLQCDSKIITSTSSCIIKKHRLFVITSANHEITRNNLTALKLPTFSFDRSGQNIPRGVNILYNLDKGIRLACLTESVDIIPDMPRIILSYGKTRENFKRFMKKSSILALDINSANQQMQILADGLAHSYIENNKNIGRLKEDINSLRPLNISIPGNLVIQNKDYHIVTIITFIISAIILIVTLIKCGKLIKDAIKKNCVRERRYRVRTKEEKSGMDVRPMSLSKRADSIVILESGMVEN